MRQIVLCFFAAALCIEPLSGLTPGSYDPAIVGADDDLITGYYQNCTAECKFSCNVYFEGRKTTDSFAILAYYPGDKEVILGTAHASDNKLHIKLNALPDGCWNVEPEFNRAGVMLLRDTPADWLQVRVLRYLTNLRPEKKGKAGPLVEKGQAVLVLKKSGRWYFVKKPGGEKTSGWIKESELIPLRLGRLKQDLTMQ